MNRFAAFLTALLISLAAFASAPASWFLAGSKPANYDTGVDQTAIYNGLPSSFLKAKADQEGFGTLMQNFAAAKFAGQRVRMSGYVKSENVTRWAGLWVRVDGSGAQPQVLAFDNMQSRPIKGTTDWQRYEVVLDVPASAQGIALGILLEGPGEVWLNGVAFDIVDASVPVTDMKIPSAAPDGPRNLSFTH